MKNLLILICVLLFQKQLSAQSISRSVIPTNGGNYKDSNLQVSATLGETFTYTLDNSNLIATQGFQQPDEVPGVTASITMTGSNIFCQGDSVILHANIGADFNYQWLNNNQPIAGATSHDYHAFTSGVYTIRVSNIYTFYAVSAPITITTHNPPVITSTSSASIPVCNGTMITLTASGAVSYLWSGGVTNAAAFPASLSTTYTVTGTDVNGCTSTATQSIQEKDVPSVQSISNKQYCNGQTVNAVPLSGAPAGVTFDIAGGASRGLPDQTAVTTIPAFTATSTGTAIISITPKANGCVGTPSLYSMTVSSCSTVTIHLKMYLHGYYDDNGMMSKVLYNEGEVLDPASVLTDYVIVELHAATPPYSIIKTTTATLKTNGTLTCTFVDSVLGTPYYIVIHHRNTIETWSAEPVTITPDMTYDFSTAASKAFGDNQVDVSGNGTIWAMYTADLNQDENVDLMDMPILESDIADFTYGYTATDLNGDGNTDLLDVIYMDYGIGNYIFSMHP